MNTIIESIKKDIHDVINNISTQNLIKVLKYASNKYYNEEEVLTDKEYDTLYELLKTKSPKNAFLKQIGSKVHTKNKIELPFHMGSMDKIKPFTGNIDKWKKTYKGPYIISDKLDGVSGLFVVDDDDNKKLYTRGDGTIGTNISSLIPLIKTLDQKFELNDFAVRGEFIISKKNFQKYKNKYSNARSMINGIINKKNSTKEDFKIVDFIIYEFISSSSMSLSKQMKNIKKLNLNLVNATRVEDINDNNLSKLFKTRKKNSIYEVDGLVITNDNKHEKNSSGNPKYAFAFKDMSLLDSAIVEVVNVEWNISKDGLLKPRIAIKPVSLSGVVIKYVTGFNGKYIMDNKIGKGSKLKIIRSGDVIPHIIGIEKSTQADMPNIKYKWIESKVDIIVDESNELIKKERLIKSITYFFKTIQVKNIDARLVEKIIDIKLDSIQKILKAKDKDFLKIEGFKETMATKIYENIQNSIKNIKLSRLMTASNIFGSGFGIKKFDAILKVHPDIIRKKYKEKKIIVLIKAIDGFEEKTAIKFAKGIPKFIIFLKTIPMVRISVTKVSGNKLKDIKVVFSGFRDKELEEKIENEGGKVVGTISKNTTYLIVKDSNETSSKITKAKELNIKIITKDLFIKKIS